MGTGHKVVMAIKSQSEESPIHRALRTLYYRTLANLRMSSWCLTLPVFGLYDRQVIQLLQDLDDPYPYFRGLIADIGFQPALSNLCSRRANMARAKAIFRIFMKKRCWA